jgi:hypothetical protein
VESLAIKIAGFYERALATPPFALSADVRAPVATRGDAVTIRVSAKDEGNAAPDSILEMEIWDASGKTVFKQHKANENFAANETRTYEFSWTPTTAGEYTVNLGAYGPKWMPSYAWKVNA